MDNVFFISAGIASIVMLVIYALIVPRKSDALPIGTPERREGSKFLRFLTAASYELNTVLPEGVGYQQGDLEDPALKSLLLRSANPWGITVEEFKVIRWVFFVIGAVVGTGLGALLQASTPIPWIAGTILGGFAGFIYPRLYHNGIAERRDSDFKRQMPEALDLIRISIGAGKSLSEAIRQSLPNMQDGILKDEFASIIKNVDAGKTVSVALSNFAERVPNEGIKAFVNSIRESTELNVPIGDALENRSNASREEYFSMIKAETGALNEKALMVLGPMILISLLILAIAPSIASLTSTIGTGF